MTQTSLPQGTRVTPPPPHPTLSAFLTGFALISRLDGNPVLEKHFKESDPIAHYLAVREYGMDRPAWVNTTSTLSAGRQGPCRPVFKKMPASWVG